MESVISISENEVKPLEELYSLARGVTDEDIYLRRDDLIRVLRARDLNVKNAFVMWEKWYNWRKTYRADSITEEEMMSQIVSGKVFIHGQDKSGRPCIIVRPRYHRPERFSTEESMRFIIYIIEQGIKIADAKGIGQLCVIYDRGGITSENRDYKLIELGKSLSAVLQDFFAAVLYLLPR